MTCSYGELSKRISESGLMNRQYGYYIAKILFNISIFSLFLFLFFTINNFWLQLLNAAFLAFVFVQTSFIMHDSAHHQVFNSNRKNDILGLIHSGILGVSYSWWFYKHNEHHSKPNEIDGDPDIDFPVIAFSPEQTRKKNRFFRFLVKFQHLFFFFYLTLVVLNMRFHSMRVMLTEKKVKFRIIEIVLFTLGIAGYAALVFSKLNWWQGALFIYANLSLTGLYLATVFAPNHKGMPILKKGHKLDFMHQQIITSRNIKGSFLVDLWYGGLNYQIEHHLFTKMPRNNLRKAQPIVQEFCETSDIKFHQTGIFRSWTEIFSLLRNVAKSA